MPFNIVIQMKLWMEREKKVGKETKNNFISRKRSVAQMLRDGFRH